MDGIGHLGDYVLDVGRFLLATPLRPDEKFFVVYLATFVALAWWSWRHHEAGAGRFLAFLFPMRIYGHPSARTDYGLYVVNVLLSPLVLSAGAGVQTAVALAVGGVLVGWNGGEPLTVGEWGLATQVAFVVGLTLSTDLSTYLVHRAHHASRILWPIHALHHSAEVMTPVTLFRKHPVWNLTANLAARTFAGAFQGVFLFLFFGKPTFAFLFGVNAIYVAYDFFGSNLRHSHVWLSWGPGWSRVFISPAMHQIHHDPNRVRVNYGEVFALWDWLFGTLYVPREREHFEIGLGSEGNPHASLARAYWVPVVDSLRELGRALGVGGRAG